MKFVWSHDAFRVGEDGPTHEPVEQEAQIRLMEKLQNHSGRDSVRVLRPADVNETTVCWKMAMENMDTPTALILSRQNVANLPEGYRLITEQRAALTTWWAMRNPKWCWWPVARKFLRSWQLANCLRPMVLRHAW